ncbi:MAG TPA: hypothetical protein VM052_09345 [Candidatus Limnocylindrales bacterium]|nr:hypothetical protein [Candidatus Limnocylindrales bacterium]
MSNALRGEDGLRRADDALRRRPVAPAIPAFEHVRARAERRGASPSLWAGAGLALLLVVILVRPVTIERSPAASYARPFDLPAGVAVASPAGTLIAVTDATTLRIIDAVGHTIATAPALRYPRWLPDSSAIVGTLDRAGTGVDVPLPLVLVARDGTTTPLGIDLPATSLGSLAVAADGRALAVQDGAVVVRVATDGATRRTIASGVVVGWDARGRLLVRDGGSLIAFAESGEGVVLSVPALPARVDTRISPDGTAAIIAGTRGTLVIGDRDISPIAADLDTAPALWIGGRELVARAPDGALWAIDARTLARRPLAAVLDAEAWSSVRAISGGHLLWFRAASGHAHVVDLLTGADRVIDGLSATSTFQALSEERFLVTGREQLLITTR